MKCGFFLKLFIVFWIRAGNSEFIKKSFFVCGFKLAQQLITASELANFLLKIFKISLFEIDKSIVLKFISFTFFYFIIFFYYKNKLN